MRKIKLLTSLLLLISGLLSGQDVLIVPAQFPADQSAINIVGLTQDGNGHIWIASNNSGLFKYDGVRLTAYASETNSYNENPATNLESVLADKRGNIWLANFQEGLDLFDPITETFTHFKHAINDAGSIRSNSIRAILEDRDGLLWIGTAEGLDRYDYETGKFIHFEGKSEDARLLNKEHIRALYEDQSGIIWIGCGSPFFDNKQNPQMGGLYKLDKTTGEVTRYHHDENDNSSLLDNRVRAIFEDSRGVFWVGTSGDGLHTMDRNKGTFEHHFYDPENPQKLSRPELNNSYDYTDDHITFINEDEKGYIWIGTFSGGLNRYDPISQNVTHFGENETEPYKTKRNDFWTSLKTEDNLLWLTGWTPNDNSEILYKVITSTNTVNHTHLGKRAINFLEDKNGTIWIETSRGLLRKNSDGSFETFLINEEIGSNIIINIEPDEKNNLWLSTGSGLFYFNTSTNEFKEYPYYKDIENVEDIQKTVITTKLNGDGTISIATLMGLFVMDINSETIKHYTPKEGDLTAIRDKIVTRIKIDKAGNYWIGTNAGLNRFDLKTGKFRTDIKRKIPIYSIFEDSKNRVWFASFNSGLFLYNSITGLVEQYTDSMNIIGNKLSVSGITEDKQNAIWLNTGIGLVKLIPETKRAITFGRSWNIDAKETTGNIVCTSEGELLVGDRTGYYHFYPADFDQEKKNLPKPFISKIFIGNIPLVPGDGDILEKSLSETKTIKLPFDKNNFTFEFNNIDYIIDASEKNLLYKLENYDDLWRKKNGDEKAYYFNVPPGKYTFQIKAVNLYGNWGEKSLNVIISPPWYKTWFAYIVFVILFFLAIYFVYKFQRENVIKEERKRTMEKELLQAREIEKAYTELKSTQSQLIQSEKMASLGELTAGIAHEIQNPLNFVNNFSEVNSELIDELEEEVGKGNFDEVKSITKDIKENEQKINHHGKRAEAIVKGMLQHSRTSNGKKEPTNINTLADEYLRLSYHGLRAKDKSFNADFKTKFDELLPKINVVPQDIGRVLLNLINNAFYACAERSRSTVQAPPPPDKSGKAPEGGIQENRDNYKPLVIVRTASFNPPSGGRGALISVKDNGPGIPSSIKDKIFQPFFTTKPTGQGTGLGLSMSYDIITKGHNGRLEVKTQENIGTEFIITLPTN